MAKKIVDSLNVNVTPFNFNIELRSGLVGISGDSGVGKSLYFDLVKKLSSTGRLKGVQCIGLKNGLDLKTNLSLLNELLRNSNNIILIDNADCLITDDKLRQKFISSDNQFIVFTRKPNNFGIEFKDRAVLEVDEGANTSFHLNYYNR